MIQGKSDRRVLHRLILMRSLIEIHSGSVQAWSEDSGRGANSSSGY
jgi:hypothetical protein